MPLTPRAKGLMAVESLISYAVVLLVVARCRKRPRLARLTTQTISSSRVRAAHQRFSAARITTTGRAQRARICREVLPSRRDRSPEMPCEPTTTAAASRSTARSTISRPRAPRPGSRGAEHPARANQRAPAPSRATTVACCSPALSSSDTSSGSIWTGEIPAASRPGFTAAIALNPGSHTVTTSAALPGNSSAALLTAAAARSEPS